MSHTPQNKRKTILIRLAATLGAAGFIALIFMLTSDMDIALLNPKGMVANEQHWLLIMSTLLMLAFGVPVILTVYYFIWKYRDTGDNSTYAPETKVDRKFLLFAWGGPLSIVVMIAAMMLPSTQRLEPQKSITADKDQMTIQVVALNWKWLFIYPEQNIATVNYAQIPVDTPVRFELTADEAPMNSFWIPHLGGMLYAMTGHVNPLNLIADTTGEYPGGAAELNGRGLAGMRFVTKVSTQADFDAWVAEIQNSPTSLNEETYASLLEPSENNPPAFYSNPDNDLFSNIVSKYSSHEHDSQHEKHGSY